jgi:excisionase family DNA binding protein
LALKREFLSTNQVAELLGITPFTIRRYIQLRKLKAVKLEGSYRVRQTDLEQFLKARETETEEELAAQETKEPRPRAARLRANPVEKKGTARPVPKTKPRPTPRALRRQREEA